MSDTPRTDMMENEALAEYRYCELSFNVMRDHARDLERELAEKTRALSDAQQEIARLKHDIECRRENMLEMQRDHREAIADAVAEARREAQTGEPYGTY